MDAELFKKITEAMYDTYKAKNADYGDSFNVTRNEFPNAILIRLNDKFLRLKQLYKNGMHAEVKNESVKDTLLDIANYCVLELIAIINSENADAKNKSENAEFVIDYFDSLNMHLNDLCTQRTNNLIDGEYYEQNYNATVRKMQNLQCKFIKLLSDRVIPPQIQLMEHVTENSKGNKNA